MMIAIAASKNSLKANVDPHFGRCDWYCLYNTETHENSFIGNPVKHNPEKTGCDAAELLLGKNVNMAIAGRFGSKVVRRIQKKQYPDGNPRNPTNSIRNYKTNN